MRNAMLDEAQAGIKIPGRNINNLRYIGDTTLMAVSERTKGPLDESERREGKSWFKIKIQETKIMAYGPITSWQIDGESVETERDFFLAGGGSAFQNHCRW